MSDKPSVHEREVAIVRGLDLRGDGRATDIPIPPERDLFG